jgi:hypothetical protein
MGIPYHLACSLLRKRGEDEPDSKETNNQINLGDKITLD